MTMEKERPVATEPKRSAAQRVAEAARQLFRKQGIHATGVEEVCRLAGTTKMGLYRSYPSKDALVESLIRETCQQSRAEAEQALADVPAADRPAAYLRLAASRVRDSSYRCCAIGQVLVEFPDPDHPVRRVADSQRRTLEEGLERLCADAGYTDPAELGRGLLLLMEGASAAAAYMGGEMAAQALENAGMALLEKARAT